MKVGLTRREATALLKRFAALQFGATDKSKAAFWKSLSDDERVVMERVIDNYTNAWVWHFENTLTKMAIDVGGIEFARTAPALDFAPEPEEEVQP